MRLSFAITGILSIAATGAAAAPEGEVTDTTRVLDEVVVMETAAKAPVPLLPLDVKIVGPAPNDNRPSPYLLPVLQQPIPGMVDTQRGLAG